MRIKHFLILAAVAGMALSCISNFEATPTQERAIGFSTWSEVLTKAPMTAFANGDAFAVYGFKWNAGPADQTNVFEGTPVSYDGTKWEYSPLRFFDGNFDNYSFFAVYPTEVLAAEANENDYAQRGLFVTNELTYDGSTEQLLVAQKTDVAKANYGDAVALHFKHAGALVDIKFKKSSILEDAVVAVTSIALSNIQTKGTFTVASYDGDNNPVGATVSEVAGLGWALAGTPVVNATPAVDPYLNNSGVSLAAGTGTTTGTAAALISNLVVMPQVLTTGAGAQTITLSYTITTGTGGSAQTITFTDKSFEIGAFDRTDNDTNTATFISNWMPGVHYTYYITINANAIQFSATIDDWTTDTGYHYLVD